MSKTLRALDFLDFQSGLRNIIRARVDMQLHIICKFTLSEPAVNTCAVLRGFLLMELKIKHQSAFILRVTHCKNPQNSQSAYAMIHSMPVKTDTVSSDSSTSSSEEGAKSSYSGDADCRLSRVARNHELTSVAYIGTSLSSVSGLFGPWGKGWG